MPIDRREALLDAAEQLILAEGYAGASTRAIAQAAGVPLSLVHYHFGGKEGLLVALVERARDRTRQAVQSALLSGAAAPDRAVTALRAVRESFLSEGSAGRLVLELAVAALHSDALRAEVVRLYGDTIQGLGVTVAAVLAQSGVEAPKAKPEAIASLLVAAGYGLALQRMLGANPSAADGAFDLLHELLAEKLQR